MPPPPNLETISYCETVAPISGSKGGGVVTSGVLYYRRLTGVWLNSRDSDYGDRGQVLIGPAEAGPQVRTKKERRTRREHRKHFGIPNAFPREVTRNKTSGHEIDHVEKDDVLQLGTVRRSRWRTRPAPNV